MKCKRCKDKIDTFKPPFGAYFCRNDHAQCGACELVSSMCVRCNEETKFKSPHFVNQKKFDDSKELEKSKLQVPIFRCTIPTGKDEIVFKKLRSEFMNGHSDLISLKADHQLCSVRTLSAIITKDLFSASQIETKVKAAEADSNFRLKGIVRALRESGCPDLDSDDETFSKTSKPLKHSKEQKSQNREEFPQFLLPLLSEQSHLSNTKSSTSSCISKISLKSDNDEEENNLCISESEKSRNELPSVTKFRSLNCINLVQQMSKEFPIPIETISLDRRPFHCPLGNCVGKIFISDFNQHILRDHSSLVISHIKLGQFKDVTVDVNLCNWSPYSVTCFLIQNIATNFGSSPLKDVLPMLLMAGRYRITEDAQQPTANEEPWTLEDFLIIWLAGVVPEECEVITAISVFSRVDGLLSRWYVDDLNSIQNIVNIENVYDAAQRLVLSYKEVELLTNNFKETLNCQIGIVACTLKEL